MATNPSDIYLDEDEKERLTRLFGAYDFLLHQFLYPEDDDLARAHARCMAVLQVRLDAFETEH